MLTSLSPCHLRIQIDSKPPVDFTVFLYEPLPVVAFEMLRRHLGYFEGDLLNYIAKNGQARVLVQRPEGAFGGYIPYIYFDGTLTGFIALVKNQLLIEEIEGPRPVRHLPERGALWTETMEEKALCPSTA